MGTRKVESGSPKSIRFSARERGIYIDEQGDDSIVRQLEFDEIGREGLTLKPICRDVNISGLKWFATESLPGNSRLRDVLLSERDQLTAMDFLAKMEVWMRLLNIEKTDLLV